MPRISPDDLAKAKTLPSRTLNQEAFHQGPPNTDSLERPPPGRFEGRYHTKKDQPPLYCSTGAEMVAMMEQVRHTSLEELANSPLPVRRLARLQLRDLLVVDYANDLALDICDLIRAQLLEDDWTVSQQLGELARRRGDVHGLLAPSAGHPEATTVVVFPEAIADHIEVLDTRTVQLHLVGTATRS
jgi:RES domain-containing protein